jgi:hypothetical protein
MASDFDTYRSHLGEFIRRTSESFGSVTPAIETEFNTLAVTLFRLQFERIPPYRRLCEARGVNPSDIRHWGNIPCVPASAFRDFDLTSLVSGERTRVFRSSGTTGARPSRHFHSPESLALYEHSLLPTFRRHVLAGLEEPVQMICLTPSPALAPHSSLVHMFHTVCREWGTPSSAFVGAADQAGAWTIELPLAWRTLEEAAGTARPVVVLGTAFSFLQLLEEPAPGARPHRIVLPPRSRAMETGGYKGRTRELPKVELHRLITDRLGLAPDHLVGEYGMAELSSQAYDRTAGRALETGGRVFRFPPWARALPVSPDTGRCVSDGESGLIRVFDLANVRSVLAIQTEDLGVRRGDGFELAGRAAAAETRGCSLMAR